MAGINLRGETSGSIEIQSPAVAGDNTIILPNSNGTANQFFKNSATAGIVTYSSMVEDTSGNIGIGTDNPTNFGGSVKLALSDSGNSVLSIAAGTSSDSSILFADGTSGDSTYRGNIKYAHSDDSMRIHTAAEERIRVTSDGNVGIGTDSVGNISNRAQVVIGGDTGGLLDFNVGGDTEGRIFATDATGLTIRATQSDGNIIFQTDGSNERARITSDGLKLPNGGGIDFSATGDGGGTADSELLDDYEEGQWTPDLQFGGAKVGISYNNQYGRYVKIGRLVHVFGRVNVANKGSSTGNAQFFGLPYVTESITGTTMNIGSIWYSGFSLQGSIVQVVMRTDGNGNSYIEPKGVTTNTEDAIGDSDFINGTDMCFSITYRTS